MEDVTEMGYLYVLIGKSATGKDSIYKRLLENSELDLKEAVLYTTRPMRENETDGVEYNFVTENELVELRNMGKVIEERCFHTIDGPWYYFTVNDGNMDLMKNNYICINTLAGFNQMKTYLGSDKVKPIYIEISDIELIKRAVNREEKQAVPNIAEICRRFLADFTDFNEENLKLSGIDAGSRFKNYDLETCVDEVTAFIKEN